MLIFKILAFFIFDLVLIRAQSTPTCSSFSDFNSADSFYVGIDSSRVGTLNLKQSATFSILELEFDEPVKSVSDTQTKDIVRVSNNLFRLIYFPTSGDLFSTINFIAKYDRSVSPNLISVRYNSRVLCSGVGYSNSSSKSLAEEDQEDKVEVEKCTTDGDLIEIHKSEETQRLLSATVKLKSKWFTGNYAKLEIVFDKVIYILGVSFFYLVNKLEK